MSGGSMDYLYQRLEEVSFSMHTAARCAFRAHLIKVAAALHDIEWVDSSDYGKGEEDAAIRACLSDTATLETALEMAKVARDLLNNEISLAEKGKNV